MVSAQHISINGGRLGDALNADPFSSEGGLVICEPSLLSEAVRIKVSILRPECPQWVKYFEGMQFVLARNAQLCAYIDS